MKQDLYTTVEPAVAADEAGAPPLTGISLCYVAYWVAATIDTLTATLSKTKFRLLRADKTGETLMAYHITLFENNSNNNVVTGKSSAQRDCYFIPPQGSCTPEHNPHIEELSCQNYNDAFLRTNWIHTGPDSYCFWDNQNDGIAGVTEKYPGKLLSLFTGGAGDLKLTIGNDGTITFNYSK